MTFVEKERRKKTERNQESISSLQVHMEIYVKIYSYRYIKKLVARKSFLEETR